MISYNEFLKKFIKIKDLDPHLPNDIKITTMTTLFTFPTTFNTKFIADNMPLDENFIRTVKYGNSTKMHRTLEVKEKKKSNTANSKCKSIRRKNFYFQTTLIIFNSENNISLNVKLFRNGTIQVTGGKNISSVFWVVYNILNIFSINKTNSFANPYVTSDLLFVTSFKVVMINCIFNIGFELNKELTYQIMFQSDEILSATYDPLRHSGINVKCVIKKYDNSNQTVVREHIISMIIFEKGNIIMSGAIDYDDIIKCYVFINKFLLQHYDKIVKK